MRLALLLCTIVSFAAGCSNGDFLEVADSAAPIAAADLSAPSDFFIGRYSCQMSLDAYCALQGCLRNLADAERPDAGCPGDLTVTVTACGSYVYIVGSFTGGTPASLQYTNVYSRATGQLVAVLNDGPTGESNCVAGPNVFIDDELPVCPSDAGAPQQICTPDSPPPTGCGGLLSVDGTHPHKCS